MAMSVMGHGRRSHRFFSHAAWDVDTFSMYLAKLVVTILAPGTTFLWSVDDTPMPETWADPLRRRHALRSAHFQ